MTNRQIDVRKMGRAGLISYGIALAGNFFIYLMAQNLFKIPFLVPSGFESAEMRFITLSMILIATIFPALIATLFLTVLGRFRTRPYGIFLISAFVFLLASLAPVWSYPDSVVMDTKIALTLIHIWSAVAVAGGLVLLSSVKPIAGQRAGHPE